jgi:hypothetical protein
MGFWTAVATLTGTGGGPAGTSGPREQAPASPAAARARRARKAAGRGERDVGMPAGGAQGAPPSAWVGAGPRGIDAGATTGREWPP